MKEKYKELLKEYIEKRMCEMKEVKLCDARKQVFFSLLHFLTLARSDEVIMAKLGMMVSPKVDTKSMFASYRHVENKIGAECIGYLRREKE